MQKHFAVIVFTALVAFTWLTTGSAQAAAYDPPPYAVEITDADFCFTGNSGVGVACNSECFATHPAGYRAQPRSCPGPPAGISFATSPATVSCGSQSSLSVTVADARGLAAADDTAVTFTTDNGSVTSSAATSGGLAYATFTVPPKTSGVARIVATVGGVRAEKRIDISC